ncbi:MAG TPA: ABC transporter substrate-binding protein, partial [Candidatus Saccharimonadales bacterium]|nr:ABC transporter substrate-binding protein [Candidatus Saccharimonadales bacterium]
MNKIILVLLALIIVGVSVYVFLFRLSPHEKPLKKVTVQLNWLAQSQYAGMFVAKEKGFYRSQGLDVSFKEYQDGLDQTAFVATGGADFGISTAMEIIPSIANGNDVIAL